jgi:hypothetical protein
MRINKKIKLFNFLVRRQGSFGSKNGIILEVHPTRALNITLEKEYPNHLFWIDEIIFNIFIPAVSIYDLSIYDEVGRGFSEKWVVEKLISWNLDEN